MKNRRILNTQDGIKNLRTAIIRLRFIKAEKEKRGMFFIERMKLKIEVILFN